MIKKQISMKYITKLFLIAIASFLFVSCADLDEKSDFSVEKPQDVTNLESLNTYDLLDTYNIKSNFMLGMSIVSSDFTAQKTPYSLAMTNFNEITLTDNLMSHAGVVLNDGSMNLSSVKSFVLTAKEAGISLFGSSLSWHNQQNNTYLLNAIADIVGEMKRVILVDFESDALGTSYSMTGNSTATVVNDPKGISGNVLLVGNTTEKANQSFPKINIQLPAGLTLNDCRKVIIDFNADGSSGLYGQGMRLAINNNSLTHYGSPSSFGCPNGDWGRSAIQLDISALNLTTAEKGLNEFVLTIGSATGSGFYYIDNITIEYEDGAVVRTPEERAEIIDNAFDTWISGIMEFSAESVSSWNLMNEPMSDNAVYKLRTTESEADDTKLYLADVLGDNYARILAKYARQYYAEYGGGEALKLFVNETGLLNQSNKKCERLIAMIAQWEADGTTKIDGIGVKLDLVYSLDALVQADNKANVVKLFTLLGATNKYIRISGLELKVVDANGNTINPANLTYEQLQAVSDYYKQIISQYYALIPDGKHYGITISPVQSSTNVGLWDTGYNRKYTYPGFASGLAGK